MSQIFVSENNFLLAVTLEQFFNSLNARRTHSSVLTQIGLLLPLHITRDYLLNLGLTTQLRFHCFHCSDIIVYNHFRLLMPSLPSKVQQLCSLSLLILCAFPWAKKRRKRRKRKRKNSNSRKRRKMIRKIYNLCLIEQMKSYLNTEDRWF